MQPPELGGQSALSATPLPTPGGRQFATPRAPPRPAALPAVDLQQFYRQDCERRLRRWSSLAGLAAAALLILYLWLVVGDPDQTWYLWGVVFIPGFIHDFSNWNWYYYLKENRARYAARSPTRFGIISVCIFVYKALLLLYLLIQPTCPTCLTMDLVMLPFVIGYAVQMILGNVVHSGESSAEGCDVLSGLVAELGRFLSFVLVISVSIKISTNSQGFDWQKAFWPTYGFFGVVALALVVIVPALVVCICNAVAARWRGQPQLAPDGQVLMFAWMVATLGGLGGTGFVGVTTLTERVAGTTSDCSGWFTSTWPSQSCAADLSVLILPPACFLLTFSVLTRLIVEPLADALHYAWYTDGRWETAAEQEAAQRNIAVCPTIMWKVSTTLYSRSPYAPAKGVPESNSFTLPPAATPLNRSMDRPIESLGVEPHRGSIDLSALAEHDNTCLICYDARPDAILLECGHSGLCVRCALNLKKREAQRPALCPICRGPIDHIVKARPDLPMPGWLGRGLSKVRGSLRRAGSGVSLLSVDSVSRMMPRSRRNTSEFADTPVDVRSTGSMRTSDSVGLLASSNPSEGPGTPVITRSTGPGTPVITRSGAVDRSERSERGERSQARERLRIGVVVEPVYWSKPTHPVAYVDRPVRGPGLV
mmetsp:Transcript_5590/g.12092  ORF Transcript_5590/g.12092 Transcript_5590/m.12092 type:complete len:650 (+) Transcript_5590:34-1983(+)